jgi:glycolate oxidase iron-sulfur subunit
MDSPRGRIYQMQAVADGRLDVSNDFVEHMSCCLGCRACESACPSGVQFGKLIEAAREHISISERTAPQQLSEQVEELPDAEVNVRHHPLIYSLLRHFFFDLMLPSRFVLSLIFAGLKVYQRSGLQALMHRTGLLGLLNALSTPFQGQLALPESLMHNAQGDLMPPLLPEVTPAQGTRRYRAGFLSGCIMDQVFHDINEATVRVLSANGCEVITPPQQTCCGALHVHAGEAAHGRTLAQRNIDVFEAYDCDAIIVNSAGCGSTLKEYEHLLRDDPRYAERAQRFSQKMRDVSEFLAEMDVNKIMEPVEQIVAYHDACHLAHGQKIRQQPRQLLASIPGVTLVDLKEADWCCGSAGIYNITHQAMARTLLERKLGHILASGAQTVATGNPGCMMQIAMGLREQGKHIRVVHPIQLLDEAYQRAGVYTSSPQPTAPKIAATRQRNVFVAALIAFSLMIVLYKRNSKRTL